MTCLFVLFSLSQSKDYFVVHKFEVFFLFQGSPSLNKLRNNYRLSYCKKKKILIRYVVLRVNICVPIIIVVDVNSYDVGSSEGSS